MASRSMNKVIHNAVRRDLQRFIDALGSYAAEDPRRARALGLAWNNFDEQLTRHHKDEHEIVWPTLEVLGVEPARLANLDAEHDKMAAALRRLHEDMTTFSSSARTRDAEAALQSFQTLQTVTNDHLDHEEAEIEPVFLAHAGGPELKAMSRKFMKSQSISQAGRYFAWLTDSPDADDRSAVAEHVPAPVVAIIGGIFGSGYRRTIAPVWRV
ncbi:hemerythrin domain-containing protein [Pseudonocardia hispaniensis]|uniref:Hemerythrin domain-containing protein n=1 Tax=Pseudonocardia hispaniensis TaxID=904933 RepID=A0ABW1IZ84_9PSEU